MRDTTYIRCLFSCKAQKPPKAALFCALFLHCSKPSVYHRELLNSHSCRGWDDWECAPRGQFLLTFNVQGRSAGPEAGRGVPSPPSLPLDSTHPAMQQLRPPPAAETGSSCWGSGQQDASAAQGTKRMLGAATRRQGLHALDKPKAEVEAQKS